MSSGNRSQSYSAEEDIQLCHVYLDISQNPIVGIKQSKDQFWSRVEMAYQSDSKFQTPFRPGNSLRKRMQVINTAVSKLRGWVRQVERLKPSGASNEDILKQAKVLLMDDPLYRKGFKFDHVWHILKDCEKFSAPTPTVQQPSSTDEEIGANLSSFAINSTDEEMGATSSKRPIGIKKEKGKRKHDEGISKIIQQNNVLVDLIKKRNDDVERKLSLAEYKEENKILLKDLNSISDPNLREFVRGEHIRIMEKRTRGQRSTQNRGNEDEGQGSQNDMNSYGQYFDYLGGNITNLSD